MGHSTSVLRVHVSMQFASIMLECYPMSDGCIMATNTAVVVTTDTVAHPHQIYLVSLKFLEKSNCLPNLSFFMLSKLNSLNYCSCLSYQ